MTFRSIVGADVPWLSDSPHPKNFDSPDSSTPPSRHPSHISPALSDQFDQGGAETPKFVLPSPVMTNGSFLSDSHKPPLGSTPPTSIPTDPSHLAAPVPPPSQHQQDSKLADTLKTGKKHGKKHGKFPKHVPAVSDTTDGSKRKERLDGAKTICLCFDGTGAPPAVERDGPADGSLPFLRDRVQATRSVFETPLVCLAASRSADDPRVDSLMLM